MQREAEEKAEKERLKAEEAKVKKECLEAEEAASVQTPGGGDISK